MSDLTIALRKRAHEDYKISFDKHICYLAALRIEELERENAELNDIVRHSGFRIPELLEMEARWNALPWEEIEAALGNLKAMEYEIDWYPRESEEVLGKLLALREQEE